MFDHLNASLQLIQKGQSDLKKMLTDKNNFN